MFYPPELSLLCETFQKSHIGTRLLEREELIQLLTGDASEDPFFIRNLTKKTVLSLESGTLYHLTDSLSRSYRLLLLPQAAHAPILIIGPYRSAALSPGQLLELGEKNGISPQQQNYFTEYYESIPVVPTDASLWIMLHTFCEHLWKTPTFSVKDISSTASQNELSPTDLSLSAPIEDPLINMMAMERRYAFENEMIHAVEHGRAYLIDRMTSAFSAKAFESRLSDTLRNAKNYCIIMNTLLRKAAERGGVHPLYLDRRSSEFASKIENLPTPEESTELMGEMFRSYCHLVREHSIRALPAIVQKAIVLIDTDLSSGLSPSKLAKSLGVSLGYLSTVFKKAMNQTISEYVCRRRMEHAAYLLETTNLQIQTVALHCGILDVQYFSKLFKKQLNLTPSQYRRAHRRKSPAE